MRRFLPILLLITQALGLGSCASDACQEAFEKVKTCLAALDCKTSPDANRCAELKRLYAVDYAAHEARLKANAAEQNDTQWSCDSDWSAAAQQVLDCELSPRTCTCP
jgi:hypothetical protein